ncbi:hypothetical protein T484DRAFT_1961865 [Baffinella frigidus]|nr:hypothetical protein T484DRAFT_1961865 [Cryptophyta sp. CCMP2293]
MTIGGSALGGAGGGKLWWTKKGEACRDGVWKSDSLVVSEKSKVVGTASARMAYPNDRLDYLACAGGGSYAYSALGRGPIRIENRRRLQVTDNYLVQGVASTHETPDVTSTAPTVFTKGVDTRKRHVGEEWRTGGHEATLYWAAGTKREYFPGPSQSVSALPFSAPFVKVTPNPKHETRNVKHGTRSTEHGTRIPNPESGVLPRAVAVSVSPGSLGALR